MIAYRQIPSLTTLYALNPIDISETGTIVYSQQGDDLAVTEQNWQRPVPDLVEWHAYLGEWAERLHWDAFIGAFDGVELIGLASIRNRLAPDMAQLTTLHISQAYRRRGIATRLVQEIIALARQSGAARLYVSATPSESAVGFYLSQGFRPTSTPDPSQFALEPEDVHMIMSLK